MMTQTLANPEIVPTPAQTGAGMKATDETIRGMPRLVLHADCSTCGPLPDDTCLPQMIPQLGMAHTASTGHVVILNGTTDIPEEEDAVEVNRVAVVLEGAEPNERTFYVDIPTEDCIGNEAGTWKNVATCGSLEVALAFAQKHFGPMLRVACA